MNYALIGGNTNWSKILIKNFYYHKYKLKYTSSRYIKKKNNFINYKKIPLDEIDFVVLSSDAKRNIKSAKYFTHMQVPIFIEKPISFSYRSFKNFKKYTKSNAIYFCDYLHIYSDPIKFIKKKLKKENIKKIKLIFGKKGRERNINSSYEWLPHPLSILFYLTNKNYSEATIKYNNFQTKKKTNLEIFFKNKKFEAYICSGNNFNSTKYIVNIKTEKNDYLYDGTYPTKLKINRKSYFFKYKPLFNSILVFSKIIKDSKDKKILSKQNKKITEYIMNFLHKKKL